MQLRFSFVLLGLAAATYSRPIADSPLQTHEGLSTTTFKATATPTAALDANFENPRVAQSETIVLTSDPTRTASLTRHTSRVTETQTSSPDTRTLKSKRFLEEVAHGLSNAAGSIQNTTDHFEDVKHKYTQPFADAGAAMHNATSDVKEGFENLGDGVKNGTENLTNGVKNSVEGAAGKMKNGTESVVNGVEDGAKGALAGGKAGWNNAGPDSSS
ncbi:hypothetical protein F5879DRAFT_1066941 [Lentinula edodes]|uniref:Uncharacterized protein n=1 Tax=Lentinula edodes TaxID=5353 RepID=A0A1Q3E2B9_LENED|nr:hypothetical protein F5879DRAFT_1066941 [Lentinula edodes]GAW01373.1 hypothetical protein LENED_002964 [Lentinula edodes]